MLQTTKRLLTIGDIEATLAKQEEAERLARLPADRFAKFTDEELLNGLARLFRETKKQTCRKCGDESLHRTCGNCRAKARTLTDARRTSAQRNDARRIERRAA
jgi:hypothetical protein